MRWIILVLILVCSFSCCNSQTKKVETKKPVPEITKNSEKGLNYNLPLMRILDSLGIQESELNILISKSQYRLNIVKETLVLKSYPVVFGFNPTDDKLCEGDGCTPEGTFKMQLKYPHNSWSKFIWIDYPNNESWRKHNLAKRNGHIPGNSQIGGEVGIHGVPRGSDYLIDQKQNWTLGCISLKTEDINEIYPIINSRTAIKIQR